MCRNLTWKTSLSHRQHLDHSVMVEKLTTDDINLWTGCVPHWSKINPYSSLSEADSDTNNNQHQEHNANRETDSMTEYAAAPVHNLRPCKRTYHSSRLRRNQSQSVFYRDMCQNIPHQPRTCHKPTPRSEPSTSREYSLKNTLLNHHRQTNIRIQW